MMEGKMFLSLIRRHEGWFSFALVLALLVVGFASFQAFFSYQEQTPIPIAQASDLAIAIYPDHGPAGSYIGVSGTGWPGATTVTIRVADAQGRSDILARGTTGADGSLSTGFLYPFDQRWLTPGSYTVLAEVEESTLQATTPFLVSNSALPATLAPTATSTLLSLPAVLTQTVTTTPTATSELPPTATATPPSTATVAPTLLPSFTPTDTSIPTPLSTETPLPTDTPVPPPNQPPQVQAALVPIDIDDDKEAGIFQIQVEATDREGSLQAVLVILKLPPSAHEREPKLKADDKIEVKFSEKRLEIKGPDPQALLDQITAYGGLLMQNGQRIDLRIKNKAEGKVGLRGELWRVEARGIELVVIATDAAGLTSSAQVTPCGNVDCSVPNDDDDD